MTPPRPPCCDHPGCTHAGGKWHHAHNCTVRLIEDTDPDQYPAALDGPGLPALRLTR